MFIYRVHILHLKLDMTAPLITKHPPKSFTNLSERKKKNYKNVTCDMWHMTCDTWHVTCDIWQMTCGGRQTFSQNFSSLPLTIWEWRCSEDFSTNDHWPATPGLLLTVILLDALCDFCKYVIYRIVRIHCDRSIYNFLVHTHNFVSLL